VHLKWPLTGRAGELRIIEAAIGDPDASGIVICGAAGVGKSRIAREALALAASKGYEVRWAVATSSARQLPLGAFAPWTPPTTDNMQLVRGVIESLTSAPEGSTAVIGVDDVHLLDDLSAFALHQIIQQCAGKVVMTVRDGEAIPAGVQELWVGGQFERLDLQPLSADETATLLSAAVGGPVDRAATGRLWKLTQGNALYLHHIVEQEVTDARLVEQQGYWRWSGEPVVAPALIELIESRIGALPPAIGAVIDALAVAEPIELGSLARITNPAAVEEADVRGLITLEQVDGTVEVRIAHPLYGEVRKKRAPPTRLRRLRGLVAKELAAGARRNDARIVVRRATLMLESDLDPDPALFLTAARTAIALDTPLAERLARAAVLAGGGMDAQLMYCYCLVWHGRAAEAERELATLEERAGTDLERVQIAEQRAHNLFWTLRRPADAEAVLDEAGRQVTEPSAIHRLAAVRAAIYADLGRPRQAVKAATEALADASLPDRLVVLASWGLLGGLGMLGRADEIDAVSTRGYAAVARTPDAAVLRMGLAYRHMIGLKLAGRLHDAERIALEARPESEDSWFPHSSRVLLGQAALAQGNVDRALRWLGEARASLDTLGDVGGWLFRCRLSLTQALAMAGQVGAAKRALAELDENRHPAFVFLEPELLLARAWVAAAGGSLSQALALAREAADLAAGAGQLAYEVLALQTAVGFGDRGSADRLATLATKMHGPRAAVATRFAVALEAGDGAELASASEEFERMGDLIAAVDAAAHAAIAYRRKNLRGSALGCSTRAEALAEHCGASTPMLRQASERLPLTDREREIVTLIGEGLSNRDIATTLTLSVRTVESHIYKAMAKTGTGSRDELAALLPRSHR
jgi:DNA-binding CsgD family transcriptional regulator/tetratricopeptide (TPR) repeat protein